MFFSFQFNLTCKNQWKVALVGTMHNLAHFIVSITSGYFSDLYGRKTVLIFSVLAGGTFGIARSFAWSYLSFIIMEFCDALFVGGCFVACFVLGNYRNYLILFLLIKLNLCSLQEWKYWDHKIVQSLQY